MSKAQTLVNFEELDRFEESVHAFLKDEIDADRFQSIRLQQGVYGQRQEGVNMIRVKVPGGRMTPAQLDKLRARASVHELIADPNDHAAHDLRRHLCLHDDLLPGQL